MRVGVSWDLDVDAGAPDTWNATLSELSAADGLGFDSAWVAESRVAPSSCSSPALFLTYAAVRTSSIRLHLARRGVGAASPVRVAEEIAVLDVYSRGRAGVAFAAASRQAIEPAHLHEVVEFVQSAWALDEMRYRGAHVRFPAHTPGSAPEKVSTPPDSDEYVPQWERGPAMPDYLAVTPKPFAPRPPVHVEIVDDETLEWAARRGLSPIVGAEAPTAGAVERLSHFATIAAEVGHPAWAVEPVLERRIAFDEPGDAGALGGSPRELVEQVRSLRALTGLSHLVWRRSAAQLGRSEELMRFASEVQPLLQA